jgi:hypothetical protein
MMSRRGRAPKTEEKAERKENRRQTSINGSCPLICTLIAVRPISTNRSFALRLPGIGTVTSTSPIVWVHLYGSVACSASSLARASASTLARSDGVGDGARSAVEEDMFEFFSDLSPGFFFCFVFLPSLPVTSLSPSCTFYISLL